MRELTGLRIKKVSPASAWAEPTDAGRKLGLREAFGVRGPIRPLFAAADATAAETLATYPDGSAAVALRRTGDGWSLFVGPPGLTSELLRLAARQAGVHLVTQTDCNVYANGPYLVLHASQDGPLEIDTGLPGRVRDLLTGQTIGQGPQDRVAAEDRPDASSARGRLTQRTDRRFPSDCGKRLRRCKPTGPMVNTPLATNHRRNYNGRRLLPGACGGRCRPRTRGLIIL